MMSGPPINPHTHWWHFPANLWSLKAVLKTVASLWKVLVLHPWKSSSFVDKLPSLNVTFFSKKHVDRRIVNSGNVMGCTFIITRRKLDFCKEFRGNFHSSPFKQNTQSLRLHQIGIHPGPQNLESHGLILAKEWAPKNPWKIPTEIERFPFFGGRAHKKYGGKLSYFYIFLVEQQNSVALFEVLLDQAEWKATGRGYRWTVGSQPFTGGLFGCWGSELPVLMDQIQQNLSCYTPED